jgi:flagellar biosynthesis GTPase FlhF
MKWTKKTLAVVLSVVLISTSISPREVEARGFFDSFVKGVTDFAVGLFTFITAPIWVWRPDNPTFRKNSPFRKKVWEEDNDVLFPNKEEEEKKKFVPMVTHNTKSYKYEEAEQLNKKIEKQQGEIEELRRLIANKSESIKSTQEDVVFAVDNSGNIHIKNKQWQKNKMRKAEIKNLEQSANQTKTIEANVSLAAWKEGWIWSWCWSSISVIGAVVVLFLSKVVEGFGKNLVTA